MKRKVLLFGFVLFCCTTIFYLATPLHRAFALDIVYYNCDNSEACDIIDGQHYKTKLIPEMNFRCCEQPCDPNDQGCKLKAIPYIE